ncbi:MAG TPA: hypothetical protein VFT12_10290, partial [Thermoanaerobaculia bacterium]|nr:hypothetical protein [Thermoanaerobaculia bacterium]
MRDEVPAAVPLILFAAALGFGPHLVNLRSAAAAAAVILMLLLGVRRVRAATLAFMIALGLLLALNEQARRLREQIFLRSIPAERFVVVEATIEGDWSARPHVHVLHASRFHANGDEIRAPIAIYARFDPPPIGMEAVIRAEGHLRPGRRHGYTMSLKSSRLMAYTGRLSPWSP